MTLSQEGIKMISAFEGIRLKPYLCSAGVATIGIGSTYYEDGTKVSLKDPNITLERAYSLFSITVKNYEKAVLKLVKTSITQNQFDSLVSLCYNIGAGNLAKSTVIRLVNSKYTEDQMTKAFLMWNKAGGKVINGLTKRRTMEAFNYNKK